MKRVVSLAIAAIAGQLVAGTYIWTGEGNDGKWFTRENWKYDDGAGNVTNPAATAPANTCADDITIDGPYAVAYEPGGDLKISGKLTLINGASFNQTTGTAYCDVKGGTIYLASGGSFDSGTMTGSNGVGLSNVIVDDGGILYCRRDLKRSKFEVRRGGRLELTVDSYKFPATDDIQEGGVLIVSGNISPQAGTAIASSGSVITSTGQFKPQTGAEFGRVDVICTHANISGAVSLLSGSVTFTDDTDGGMSNAGGTTTYFDFPAGSTCKVSLPGDVSTVYSKTFGTSSTKPKYRYDGSVITSEQFMSFFTVEEDDGIVSFQPAPISEDAPEIASASIAQGVTDTSIVVDTTFTKIGNPAASVYLVYDTVDRGRKLADWGDNNILVGTATSLGFNDVVVSGVPAKQALKMRLIAVNEEGSSASDLVALYTRHYGVEGTVNEWIGTVGNWTDGTQWSLGHQPTDSEIRWIENADAVVTKNNYTLNDTDHMIAGTLALTGELSADVDYTLDGFNFSCTTFVPGSNRLTIKNGNLTAYRTGRPDQAQGGVYGTNARVDVLSGGTASMCFLSKGTIYADTFGGNRFTFNGLKIDETEFNKRFEYERIDDGPQTTISVGDEEVTYYAYRLYLKPSEGEPKVESFGASFSNDRITFTLQQAADSIADTVVTVYYGTTDRGATTNDWAASAVMEKDGNGINTATVDVTPGSRFYYAILAESETADMMVWRTGDVVAANLPTDRKVWVGNSSDASDPSNWQGGTLPGASDVIEINDLFGKNLTINWNSTAIPSVAGWVQSAGIVYFDTTLSSAVTVKGDVALSGSANWTHIGPAAQPEKCINVIVEGDMTVGTGAIVQSGTAKENDAKYRARGYYEGPGFKVVTNIVEDAETVTTNFTYLGGSYAGDGGHQPFSGVFNSYGSILNPRDWGSAGKGDSRDAYSGAGCILMTVAGDLLVDGSIASHGFGWDAQKSGASGGTVNITAATLSGSGSIDADGGKCLFGPGSGGRIRVKLTTIGATFGNFTAPSQIHANPGLLTNITGDSLSNDVVLGAAGTVVLQLADDTEATGTVLVSDTNQNRRDPTDATSIISATHLPARQNPTENLRHSAWSLNGYGKIRLTANASIGGLSLSATDGTQCVFTDGYTLTTASLVVNGTRYRYGTYTAETNPEFIKGDGSIVVGGSGFILMIR